MSFEFLPDRNVCIETFRGDFDYDALVTFTQALHRHPEYDPDMSVIIDVREGRMKLDYDDMVRFVQWLDVQERKVRGFCAFLTKPGATHGVTRMYAALGEDLQEGIRYFETREEALAWIDEMIRVRDV